MTFNELVTNNSGGIFYLHIIEIKKEIENINKELISKNKIPNAIPLFDESVTYCFDETLNDGKIMVYRDCNERCTSVCFYYDYDGTIIVKINKLNDKNLTANCIEAYDDYYVERILKIMNNISRKKVIADILETN